MSTMFYLPPEHWSPRYDSTFFTAKVEAYNKCNASPCPGEPGHVGGNTHHPAVYYEVAIYCQHERWVCYRRYSNFHWMHMELLQSPPVVELPDVSTHASPRAAGAGAREEDPIMIPPKTCPFFRLNDEFLEQRRDDLNSFMNDFLQRPGSTTHPAVVTFLKLHTNKV
eukprot:scaffold19457_cov49-Attheya_sp.AAC.6